MPMCIWRRFRNMLILRGLSFIFRVISQGQINVVKCYKTKLTSALGCRAGLVIDGWLRLLIRILGIMLLATFSMSLALSSLMPV